MLSTETTLRVINTIKVRLLQDFVQSITIILKKDRMEKLLQFCAGFVKCKNGCKNDVIELKWLLLAERKDSWILQLVYDGIKKEDMPVNLKVELKKQPEHQERTRQ